MIIDLAKSSTITTKFKGKGKGKDKSKTKFNRQRIFIPQALR
jgi:hypothetical protein